MNILNTHDIWEIYILTHSSEFWLCLIGNFSFTEKYTVKYAGAAAMYFVSKNLKKKYNITDERASLYEAVEQWVNALDGREFLGRFPHISTLIVCTYMTSEFYVG